MSTKRLSWGTGIIITCAVFMMISLGTTIFFMNQDVDLVSDKYYEKELKYQQQINKLQQTKDMNADVEIQSSDKSIILKFPDKFIRSNVSGEVVLYRPSNAGKDYIIPVAIGADGSQQISTDKISRGLWKVKISWESDSNHFYSEKSMMVY